MKQFRNNFLHPFTLFHRFRSFLSNTTDFTSYTRHFYQTTGGGDAHLSDPEENLGLIQVSLLLGRQSCHLVFSLSLQQHRPGPCEDRDTGRSEQRTDAVVTWPAAETDRLSDRCGAGGLTLLSLCSDVGRWRSCSAPHRWWASRSLVRPQERQQGASWPPADLTQRSQKATVEEERAVQERRAQEEQQPWELRWPRAAGSPPRSPASPSSRQLTWSPTSAGDAKCKWYLNKNYIQFKNKINQKTYIIYIYIHI